jgi:hypothetical protein
MFVFGEAVQPGIIGNNPTIPGTTTVNDNVPMQFDFRQVYASVLQDWFELPAADIKTLLNGSDFNTLPIFKSNPMGLEDFADLMTQIEISNVWPNPTTGKFKLSFNSDGGGKLGISVYNPLGERVVFHEPKEYGVGRFEIEFDLSGFRKGNYILQLSANQKTVSRLVYFL